MNSPSLSKFNDYNSIDKKPPANTEDIRSVQYTTINSSPKSENQFLDNIDKSIPKHQIEEKDDEDNKENEMKVQIILRNTGCHKDCVLLSSPGWFQKAFLSVY